MAFFPMCGREACAFTPIALILRLSPSSSNINLSPVSSSNFLVISLTSASLSPFTTAVALPGTTFILIPPFKDTRLGVLSVFSYSAVNSLLMPPFSILIRGQDASGVIVIGAAFSLV